MGYEMFTRVVYFARIKKSEIYLHPLAAIVYSDDDEAFLHLFYQGEDIPLTRVKAESADLMQLSFDFGEWVLDRKMSLVELLDLLWDHGVNRNYVFRQPREINADKLGTWFYGNSMRYVKDGERITLEAVKIAFNEVLDSNMHGRNDSYARVGGSGKLVGIVYGADFDEDDDAVRLAIHVNHLNGTDFGKPKAVGVDPIVVCGGTGSKSQDDYSVLSHAVLTRSSGSSFWFLYAALAKEEHAKCIVRYCEETGLEAKVVKIDAAAARPYESIGHDAPDFEVAVKLDADNAQSKADVQEYVALSVASLVRYGKEHDMDILYDENHPVMGWRLLNAKDPALYMRRALSAFSREQLDALLEKALQKAVHELLDRNQDEFSMLTADALITLMSEGD